MNSIIKKIEQLSLNTLIIILTVIGALIAVRLHYIQQGAINNDFVLYHEAARLFAANAWHDGFRLFGWPLYSILIAAIHKVTSLSLHTSAQLLSIGLFALTTAAFLKIIEMAGGAHKTLLAGALILFSSQYIVGDVLPMLVRDHGFWAFFLLSLIFFIRFYQSYKVSDAFLWQLFAIIAMLFRIEMFTYLALLPMLLLFCTEKPMAQRWSLFFKAHGFNLAIGALIAFAFLFSADLSINDFGRLREIFSLNLYEQTTQKLLERADIMATEVLGDHLDEFAIEGLLLIFIFIIVTKIISSSGWISIALAAMTLRKKISFIQLKVKHVLFAVMSIALLNMLLIITKVFVLSGRYVAAFTFIVMILAAFYLAYSFKHLEDHKDSSSLKKWLVIIVLAVLSLSLIKNLLPKAEGHGYEQHAIEWVQANYPDDKNIYYSTSRLRYFAAADFAGANLDWWNITLNHISDQSIQVFDILVIDVDSAVDENTQLLKETLPEFEIKKEFNGIKDRKKAIVFVKKQS